MATKSNIRRIIEWVVGGFTVTGSIFAVGAIGWHSAIYFHAVKDKVDSIHTVASLNELKLGNDELRIRLADKESVIANQVSQIGSLTQKVNQLSLIPTDADWIVLSRASMEMYADVHLSQLETAEKVSVHFSSMMQVASAMKDPKMKPEHFTQELVKMASVMGDVTTTMASVGERMKQRTIRFSSTLVGANLMVKQSIDGSDYVSLTKYPQLKMEWKTAKLLQQ